MALYHDVRPKSLKRMIGNEDVLDSLMSVLSRDVPPHAYLLTGPHGCGKTTIGRIIGNKMGAVDTDFREVDSGDFRGIDTIRDIRKQAMYKPLQGNKKGWLIDECHKMTNDAQNALLKILEDPPPHVFFILATTNPEKLLKTIKSRCSHFPVRLLDEDEQLLLLKKICKRKDIEVSTDILEKIVEESEGHPRDAIQLLDQIRDAPSEKILEIIQKAAEMKSETILLCRALIQGAPWKDVANILQGLKNDEDPERIRRAVLGYCQAIILKKDDLRTAFVMSEFIEPFWNSGYPGLVLACYTVIKE